jgi:predicted RNase H-like HicB family nuclease
MDVKVVVREGESGYFVANVPALHGCWSQGRTPSEAVENVKEAAALWIEVEQDKRLSETAGADILAVCL